MASKKKNLRLNSVSRGAEAVIYIVLGLFSLCCIIPFIFVVIISFSSEASIRQIGYSFIPMEWSTEAFRYAFKKLPQIWRSYFNSLFITVVGTALSTLMCALYSYVLYRPDFRFRRFFNFFSFFTMIFGGGLVPTYIICSQVLGLSENYGALIVPLLVNPFNIIIMRTFFKSSVPLELIEAATIDGSGEYNTLSGWWPHCQARRSHHRPAQRPGLLERLVSVPAVYQAEQDPPAPPGPADGAPEQRGVPQPDGGPDGRGGHQRGGQDAHPVPADGAGGADRGPHRLRLPLLPALHRGRPFRRLCERLIQRFAVSQKPYIINFWRRTL